MRPEEGSGEEREQINVATKELGERVSRMRESAAAFVDEHPLAAMAVSFGLGYVVAGGLFSKMTGRLLRMGSKLVVGALVRQAAMQLPAMLLAQYEGEREESGSHERH